MKIKDFVDYRFNQLNSLIDFKDKIKKEFLEYFKPLGFEVNYPTYIDFVDDIRLLKTHRLSVDRYDSFYIKLNLMFNDMAILKIRNKEFIIFLDVDKQRLTVYKKILYIRIYKTVYNSFTDLLNDIEI